MQETMRLAPAGWVTSRRATEDVVLDGLALPAGTVVYLDIFNIHRDPKHWGPDAGAFRPERFDKVGGGRQEWWVVVVVVVVID